jgi:aminotransferase
MIATMMAVIDDGDEVIVFEPFYENYGPDAILRAPLQNMSRCGHPTGASIQTSFARLRVAPKR